MSISILLSNRRGIALIYLLVFFILLGVLMNFGFNKLGALVTQGKLNDTKNGFERNVQMIVAWGVKYGRLPAFSDYSTLFGAKPRDAWGKPVIFAYENSLTKAGGLCGQTSTTITYNAQDVAFLLLSGGDDMGLTSTPAASGAFSGALTALKTEDLHRIVTLKELQEQASCFGMTQGRLKILNNELPNVCKGKDYSATIIGDGGVPRFASYTSYLYTFSGLPAGLTNNNSGATVSGITTAAKGPYTIGITMMDKAANTVKRSYVLNLMSSCY